MNQHNFCVVHSRLDKFNCVLNYTKKFRKIFITTNELLSHPYYCNARSLYYYAKDKKTYNLKLQFFHIFKFEQVDDGVDTNLIESLNKAAFCQRKCQN